METYITRLCWNENDWKKPSGHAAKSETKSFNTKFGFGIEEWLFSSKFEINGWRYGFVQGVNKSRKKQAGKLINLLFFTINPNKRRYLVCEIRNCYVFKEDEQEKRDIHKFIAKELISKMVIDIKSVGGKPDIITKDKMKRKTSEDIVNIKYKSCNLTVFPELILVPINSIICKLNRYQLISVHDKKKYIDEWNQIKTKNNL
ncbi:MAG: hypothetical protein DRH24_16420 [Deltaproteobacteria bacterium]|nr:MAG: hypothetical protein DRH24_16420 [Deltaproteobacteria bacterium]